MQEHLNLLKRMAFNLYDMNCDNQICEFDLFSVVKHSENPIFLHAISEDLNDIKKRLS